MKIVIDHYGESAEFATLADAEAALHACASEFDRTWLDIRLRRMPDGFIYNERDEKVGRVVGGRTLSGRVGSV